MEIIAVYSTIVADTRNPTALGGKSYLAEAVVEDNKMNVQTKIRIIFFIM